MLGGERRQGGRSVGRLPAAVPDAAAGLRQVRNVQALPAQGPKLDDPAGKERPQRHPRRRDGAWQGERCWVTARRNAEQSLH